MTSLVQYGGHANLNLIFLWLCDICFYCAGVGKLIT